MIVSLWDDFEIIFCCFYLFFILNSSRRDTTIINYQFSIVN